MRSKKKKYFLCIYIYTLCCFTHSCLIAVVFCVFVKRAERRRKCFLHYKPAGQKRFIWAHLFPFPIVRISSLLTEAKATSSEPAVLGDVEIFTESPRVSSECGSKCVLIAGLSDALSWISTESFSLSAYYITGCTLSVYSHQSSVYLLILP